LIIQELLLKKRTIKLLREFVEKHGEEKYLELVKKFPGCGVACGYDLDEIKNYNVELINYDNHDFDESDYSSQAD
jgi:hypothetical protein